SVPDSAPSRQRKLYSLLAKLELPRVRRSVYALALLLVAPSVFSGFAADDWILLYELDPPPNPDWAGTPPWDLYRLFDPEHVRKLIDGGGLQWWTYVDATCGFFRPLSGLTHMLDHWIARTNPIVAHLHSVFWFALFLIAAGRLYRRLLTPGWVAGVACAMFALDTAHGGSVGWLVNRSALVGGTFAIAALILHHRARSGGGIRFALGAFACCALALLAAELSVCMLGYLVAYALFLERGSLLRRGVTLAPYLPIFAGWAVTRKLGGYGTSGLYTYVDPAQEPFAFLFSLLPRIAMLLAGQGVRLVSDVYEMLPRALQPLYLFAALGGCALLSWFAWPSLRQRAELRFFAAGAVLSAVPMGTTQPSDRLLTLVGVGVMPVIAAAVHHALTEGATGLRPKLAAALAGLHLIIAPLFLPIATLGPALLTSVMLGAAESLPDDPQLREQSVFVLVVPDSTFMSYIPVIRHVQGKARPRRLYWLSSTETEVRVERRAANVLRVTPARGFYDRRSEARSPLHPFAAGDRVELSDLTIEIRSLTPDGRPAVCDFVFKAPLESAEYSFRTWRDGQLVPIDVPALGATLTVSAL
ncbi:MAG TPA: hypothetical protein VJR89_06680, partial [Polyangiales bacterium]|nr:hypothetical protein [Polyangiales bacterium]